jgi:hypothetical protein
MVVPGSRLHENPEKYGITSISYEGNVLMAPLPVWKSNSRISPRVVRHLYHKLGHLEEVYAINEYPYVGALSTNHSFLYFQSGPDVLKRLKGQETKRFSDVVQILTLRDNKARKKKLNSIVPRAAVDGALYRSPFPLDLIQSRAHAPVQRLSRLPGQGGDFLVSRSGIAVRLGNLELQLLQRIDGKRSLKSILAGFERAHRDRLLQFLLNLAAADLVTL